MIVLRSSDDILRVIEQDDWMMGALHAMATLNLPDWWIGAGFVRNKIWDYLHEYDLRTPYNDLDGIYFDPNCAYHEDDIEQQLLDLPTP